MKRGEIWTAAGGGSYAGKPRPVVIVQSDRFAENDSSITVCPLTSDPTEAPIIRVAVDADDGNGLKSRSRIMVDKLVSMPRKNIGKRVGRLDIDDMARLERAVLIFLGLMK